MTIKLIGLRTPAGQGFNNDTLIEFKDAQRCLCLNLRKCDFTEAQLLTAIIDARSTANAYSITELRMRDRVLHNTKLLQVAVMEVVSKKIFSFSRNRHLTLR